VRVSRALALLVAVGLIAAGALPGAAAAPSSHVFKVLGAEIWAGAGHGTFVGTATGDEKAAWTADVRHSTLDALPAAITGGTLRLGSLSDYVVGKFTGGSISLARARAGCGNEKFAVSGKLAGVKTKQTSGGTGVFDVVLTHYRKSLLGHCLTYGATVAGTASFTY
jgi:hypothetical protein